MSPTPSRVLLHAADSLQYIGDKRKNYHRRFCTSRALSPILPHSPDNSYLDVPEQFRGILCVIQTIFPILLLKWPFGCSSTLKTIMNSDWYSILHKWDRLEMGYVLVLFPSEVSKQKTIAWHMLRLLNNIYSIYKLRYYCPKCWNFLTNSACILILKRLISIFFQDRVSL